MQNTKSKTWGTRRKGLTLLFLSLAQRGEDGYIIDAMTIGVGEWFIFDPMVKDDWYIATNKEFEGAYVVVED